MDSISWKVIDTYFKDNTSYLVDHHLESYNDFFSRGINNIFKENNPIRFIEREDKDDPKNQERNECHLYLGGKDGNKIYLGKPVIYDDDRSHYMYPNDARLRNMTYGTTIHYDVDVDIMHYENGEKKQTTMTLEKIYLGRFPIMLQSNLCILNDLAPEVRYNMGECRNDYGGYFIIDGKEKVIVCQETFADNMLYVRKNKDDDEYSFSAEIRSVSEDASKPMRTTAVKLVAPSTMYTNNQIVVVIPNVKKPIPLFIVMRALGVLSDRKIIETCVLDIEANERYVDLFEPSVHDACKVFNQETALEFIASFTKRETISTVLEILTNYFLPHIGETNYLDKAYFLGKMVNHLLKVQQKEEKPTDRDSFMFKRVELSGKLIYDLFREYYLIQKRAISLAIDKEYYYHSGKYKDLTDSGTDTGKVNFLKIIEDNSREFFKERIVEQGFKKAFKGNWGSQTHTKRLGVVQDLNRLSWFTFISQLRKIVLPLDPTAKIVGPRQLNSSQWGYIDPLDCPDGGNVGLHKHLTIAAAISSGYSSNYMMRWLRANTPLKLLHECSPKFLGSNTKVIVNGNWFGVIDKPIEVVNMMKLLKRNGLIPCQTSISFDYKHDEILIYTDSGRLLRPIYYVDKQKPSFDRKKVVDLLLEEKLSWKDLVTGMRTKTDDNYSIKSNKIYDLAELYPSLKQDAQLNDELLDSRSVIDLIDNAEENVALIATTEDDLKKNAYYTHLEIDPSLLLGVMGNCIIYPEHNPYPRDVFSCGQSRQAISMYHSNYHMRIDKMGVVLNYGQTPLVKSRYLEYICKEQQPYGINTIVAIMCFTGYNVEDAILVNKASIDRGLFRTTYLSMYEAREESAKISGSSSNSVFANVAKSKRVVKPKPGYDYSQLDDYGMIKENTPLDDKIILIGKLTASVGDMETATDDSVKPKKGQLGFVDKSFITEGEEGTKIAKVRVREERIPAIGDKMASRAGQKGTIGLIIDEKDMPFTAEGIRPDLIINPHAIPSRMTIGQLIESVLGKIGANYGGFGDCTAFANKGANTEVYGKVLTNMGYHSSGNEVLYNGMTGEQLQANIYIGPTYYMRLKHMVKDKINYRARGKRTVLTRQTNQGRADDGGLRIGEMERDGILAHGASHFLNESFMVRGDEYWMAVCNKTGAIAIYNPSKNLFLSPYADGPIKFFTTVDNTMNIENLSRFGRSFSVVRIPYSLKLLIQELLVMNVQMRIITDSNVDQLMSMSYSDNVYGPAEKDPNLKIAYQNKPDANEKLAAYLRAYTLKLNTDRRKNDNDIKAIMKNIVDELESVPESTNNPVSPEYATGTPGYQYYPESPEYAPGSPAYNPNSPAYATGSPGYTYNPESPEYAPGSPAYIPEYNPETPSSSELAPDFGDQSLNDLYISLPQKSKDQILALPMRDQRMILRSVKSKRDKQMEQTDRIARPEGTDILQIAEPVIQTETEAEGIQGTEVEGKTVSFNTEEATKTETSGGSNTKTIKF